MFAYAPTPAPHHHSANRPPLRLVRSRRRRAPHAARAAAAYCAGLTAGLLAVAMVAAPTGGGAGPFALAIFSATGLAAALAVGRHRSRR